jgi:hypothetical protein
VVGHGAELAGRKHECSGAVRHALVGQKVPGLKGRQQRGTADLGQPSASCKNWCRSRGSPPFDPRRGFACSRDAPARPPAQVSLNISPLRATCAGSCRCGTCSARLLIGRAPRRGPAPWPP